MSSMPSKSRSTPATPTAWTQATDLLKRLTAYLCGDMAVAHHAALLRRPGTHNSKGGAWIECTRPSSAMPGTIPATLPTFWTTSKTCTLFTRKTTGNGHDKTAARPGQDKPPIDVEARLAAMQFEGAGDASIHQTQLSVTASLLRTGVALEETTRHVLEATRAAVANDPRAGKWNWRREERKILRMGAAFIAKYPELAGLLPDDWQQSATGKDRKTAGDSRQPPRLTLAEVHDVFRKWFGKRVRPRRHRRRPGDRGVRAPVRRSAVAAGDLRPGQCQDRDRAIAVRRRRHVTSTIASEGALLSATSRRERNKKATGGLLRKIGDRGLLVVKDVTSILSADRNTRGSVLAAIREIYDGRWERNVGTDGGQTLTWTGRLVIVGAVTTAWDSAHARGGGHGRPLCADPIRFERGTRAAPACAQSAIPATRWPCASSWPPRSAASSATLSADEYQLADVEIDQLVKAADVVTMARTAVERDYQGEVIDAHAPEMPTRFAKQLAQMIRGAVAIGMTPAAAMRLAIRCARDSIPPLRREILLDVAANPGSPARSTCANASAGPGAPSNGKWRASTCCGCCNASRRRGDPGYGEKMRTTWRYSLAAGFDRDTLLAMDRGAAPQSSIARKVSRYFFRFLERKFRSLTVQYTCSHFWR